MPRGPRGPRQRMIRIAITAALRPMQHLTDAYCAGGPQGLSRRARRRQVKVLMGYFRCGGSGGSKMYSYINGNLFNEYIIDFAATTATPTHMAGKTARFG